MKRLNHNARVLVTDGGRATVFRNAGDVGKPDLQNSVIKLRNPRMQPGAVLRLQRDQWHGR